MAGKKRLTALVLAFSLLGTSHCWAGVLFISDSGTAPTTGVNPSFVLDVGESMSMYLWAQLSSTETIPGLAYDVTAATSGIVSATAHVVDNPTIFLLGSRWSEINTGTLGQLVTGSNFVKVGGGLRGDATTFDSTFDAASGSYRVSRIDFTGTTAGTTDVFIGIGTQGIALGDPGDLISLGFLDDPIANNAFGEHSTLADATITVVPEPAASLLLLAPLGGWLVSRSIVRWSRTMRNRAGVV